jgi:hypothetical protein
MTKLVVAATVAAVVICFLFIYGATAARAGDYVVEIADLQPGDMAIKGFELSQKGTLQIEAVGAGSEHQHGLFAYGWIIDTETREQVWSMTEDCTDLEHLSGTLQECSETVRLRPGKYEVYYYVGDPERFLSGGWNVSVKDLKDLIGLIGDAISLDDEKKEKFYAEDAAELKLTIKADVPASPYTPTFDRPTGAIVYFNQPEKDELHQQGFRLQREVSLVIHAIGEYSDSYDVFVDGGWIVDAGTRKKVWIMDKWNTERAGGADKNRVVYDSVTLPAGDYIAYYGTDDSHDPGEWNAPPPVDPMNYGMTITPIHAGDAASIMAFDKAPDETEIISIARVRDDSFVKKGFTLKKDARIHVVALGERGYSENQMADHGWIADAESFDRVWEMTADNTDHAGGAAKNCMFDGMIDLPAGNYLVFYKTDDSHAYGDWNAAAPYDQRGWGITLYGVGKDFSSQSFTPVDDFPPSGNVLVSLIGLGDDVDTSWNFTLTKSTTIRVTAVGEGQSGEMFDYGWIEDAHSGDVVWEMTYRKSRHAGGASKNRVATATITLEKGEYVAHFITDGSHSFEDFNAEQPDNPERWGMMITQQ